MYRTRSGPLSVKVIHVSFYINVIEGTGTVMFQMQYLTVLGVPVQYLCIQYECLSLSMRSVCILVCTNLWHEQDGIMPHCIMVYHIVNIL